MGSYRHTECGDLICLPASSKDGKLAVAQKAYINVRKSKQNSRMKLSMECELSQEYLGMRLDRFMGSKISSVLYMYL
jgi:hypothetical protein